MTAKMATADAAESQNRTLKSQSLSAANLEPSRGSQKSLEGGDFGSGVSANEEASNEKVMGQFSSSSVLVESSDGRRLALLLAFPQAEEANQAGQCDGAGAATDAHDVDRDGRIATLGLVVVKTVEDQ